MKNAAKTGRSAKRGNKPAPYTKYGKLPYKYAWERARENKHKDGK